MKFHPLKNLIFSITLIFLCLAYSQETQASHALGGDLTYECVGSNQYKVILSLYRDCNGINYPSASTISWSGNCGSGTVSAQAIPNSRVDITPVCPGQTTSCNGGTGLFGVEQQLYEAYITLPAGCTDVTFSWSLCCRNNAITTINGASTMDIYTEASVNTTTAPCNNSPVFLNPPSAYVCANNPVYYNHGAIDPDGDSLAFTLVDCQSATNSPLTYVAGYSGTQPLGANVPVSIDPATGAVAFTATTLEVAVMCILVEEYRNGILIGTTVRDMQFRVINCANQAPVLSGIDGTNNYQATIQAGNQLCFGITGTDPDADNISIAWNGAISGASFTVVPTFQTGPLTGQFCWTPTALDVGTHTFTVTIQDDACPLMGNNTYTYTIVVLPPTTTNCDSLHLALNSTNDVLCTSNDGGAILVATGGSAPYTYQVINWTTGEFFTNQTGLFTNLTLGDYGTWVTDANGCTPSCTGSTFTIGGNAKPLFVAVNTQNVRCPSNAPYAGNTANPDGGITIAATGGTAPYMYSIDGGNTFQSLGNFDNLLAGTYQVLVLDANGCSYIETVIITQPNPIQIDVVSLTNATCGQSNGSITLLATGGSGIRFYYINGQSQGTNPTFTGLAAGTYTFSVCDVNYCVYDTTITIGGGPAFQIATTTTNPSCNGDCDGTATITIVGTSGYTIQWSNGANGTTIDNLCAGSYTVEVADSNACVVVDTVIITEPAPIDVVLASSSDETCRGNDGNANLSVMGGTAPYTIQLANFTTTNAQNNNTGIFTGLNAGLHIVHAVDANGCTQSCATQFTLEGCGTDVTAVTPAATPLTAAFLQINPNPAATIAQARFDAASTTANITIVNAKGQRLYERAQLEGKGSLEMDISTWANGTYFVILKNNKGEVVNTQRMIVRR